VHRSGRTARAKREGLSVMLIGPEDVRSYRNICSVLNKGRYMSTSYSVRHILLCTLLENLRLCVCVCVCNVCECTHACA